MILHIHPDNPQRRHISRISEELTKGAIYILPTDTVYAFVTGLQNKKSIDKICQIKRISPHKPLSLYCRDFSQISEFVRMDDNRIFRWMKANLPGPYTLVFNASKNLPQFTLSKQKTVGIRLIENNVISDILALSEFPLIGSSVSLDDTYPTDPDELETLYGKQVAGIVDAGLREPSYSTVLDARQFPPEIIREGKGNPVF
jgi:tRNA threonylcarbamoyl adenosine modification protein (Sua5/YciO/YrdC/YwlC family)